MRHVTAFGGLVLAAVSTQVLAQTAAQTVETNPLTRCIGIVERGAATLRDELSVLRQRLARCAPRPPSPAVASGKDQALVTMVQNVIRARLSAAIGQSVCARIDVAFDGGTVLVKGQASNRPALEKTAAEIRVFLPELKLDLTGVESGDCRKPVPGTNLAVLLDDVGAIRRLTFDQANSLGNVFPESTECSVVGTAVAPLLPAGSSNRRMWVWSLELNGPIYCLERAGSWDTRDYQLNDGRGAAVLRGK